MSTEKGNIGMNHERGVRATLPPESELVVESGSRGYRVFHSSEPNAEHLVEEIVSRFLCNCEEYESEMTCQHVRAVLNYLAQEKQNNGGNGRLHMATQASADPLPATMTLRRSISPDGRIDSLSIEFSSPVDQTCCSDITNRALNMLKLQSVVSKEFLLTMHAGRQGDRTNGRPSQVVTLNARMIRIGEVPAKRDRPLFIEFHLENHGARLFGTAAELAQAMTDAGYVYAPEEIFAGLPIDASCQVLIKPSRNPLYSEILRILPEDFSFSER
jgi:hypothetical protein